MIAGSQIERFRVVVTHKPTGITATRTGEYFRTEREAHDSAIRYLRSRLVMLGYAPSMLRFVTLSGYPLEREGHQE